VHERAAWQTGLGRFSAGYLAQVVLDEQWAADLKALPRTITASVMASKLPMDPSEQRLVVMVAPCKLRHTCGLQI
jgi:hypothetical protein